jgi:hypothetical protein
MVHAGKSEKLDRKEHWKARDVSYNPHADVYTTLWTWAIHFLTVGLGLTISKAKNLN